jgi:hypothetical protein
VEGAGVTTATGDLFARYLDLKPLKGRRRGLVRCIFHQDRTASLSVDLDALVWNCFGCGAQGGVARFAELVGEGRGGHRRLPRAALSTLDEARRAVLEHEQRAAARREDRGRVQAADDYREAMRTVMDARALATAAGPDAEGVWELLQLAADVERTAEAALAEVTE